MPEPHQYKVSIADPCYEGWERMTPAEQGRFCNSCQKIVRDFSAVPDEEIIRYLLTHKTVCGRLSQEQQNRLMMEKPERSRLASSLYQKIAASLLLLSSFTERSFAQHQKPVVQKQFAKDNKPRPFVTVKGTLIYLDNNARLFKENVVLTSDTLRLTAVPDEHGAFEFRLPESYLGQEVLVGTENHHEEVQVIPQKVTLYTTQTAVCLKQLPRLMEVYAVPPRELHLEGMMQIMEQQDLRSPGLWRRLTRPFRKKVR